MKKCRCINNNNRGFIPGNHYYYEYDKYMFWVYKDNNKPRLFSTDSSLPEYEFGAYFEEIIEEEEVEWEDITDGYEL